MVVSAGTNNEILLKGTPLPGTLADGAFLTPSLVRVRDRQSHVVREEVFGPVLSLDVFDDDEEAVSLVNDSRMGLAASIWGGDFSRLHRAANAVRVGTVWINEHGRFAPEAEVGGYRESGLGCLFGPRGLDDFLQLKNIAWSLET
jgi:acyl-CoA reductase-like NAD-dependent aldehyde dehydrogenase